MNTAWYVLKIDDAGETLMRCSPTGFETVPMRDPMPAPPRTADAPAIPAATPQVHSPYVPTDAGTWNTPERPRATQVVNDLQNTDDPTYRYLRNVGVAVQEAIAPDPAPLYLAMDLDRANLFQMIGRTEVRDVIDRPRESLSTLWSDTRQLEVNA